MNLSELREAVASFGHLHGFTPVFMDGLSLTAAGIVGTLDESDTEEKLAESRENEDRLAAELKEAEAERDEWQRRAEDAEEKLDTAPADGPALLRDALEDAARFRYTASDWAVAHAAMQKELHAIRKRKGIEAGICAYSREAHTLLHHVSKLEGRYQKDAAQLLGKINLIP